MYYRWKLGAAALTLAAAMLLGGAFESAALQQLETHSQAPSQVPADVPVQAQSETASPPGITSGDTDLAAQLDHQIEQWIRALSAQDEFKSWQSARWTRHPLGAGMHGWLVLIEKDGTEVGYLIVSAAENGELKLTEYGAGENPLFSMRTLYRSMVQLELIDSAIDMTAWHQSSSLPERIYYSPLHAVWKVANGDGWMYIDAKTGEQLPLTEQSFTSLTPYGAETAIGQTTGFSSRSIRLQTFDPFDNTHWLTEPPLQLQSVQPLLGALADGYPPVTFTANLYGRTVLAPFAVTGFQESASGSAYIRLEQEGGRYVPFDALIAYGTFHQRPSADVT
ncbi:MAG: hypothetical protein K0Q94_978 [Paenibacillus sp.]|nr:hypothetical protein [Paenibacillus sp.]